MNLDIRYTEETEYYVAFSHVPGIGPIKVENLIKKYGSITAAYNAPAEELSRYISAKTLKKFLIFRSSTSPYSILKSLLKKDIQVLTPELPQYPNKLRNIATKPLCLYIRGDISIVANQPQEITPTIAPAIAVIGSRLCTLYGRHLTNLFTARLASAGCTIISGMAAGIDALAHETALKFRTKTLAILGCGVNIIYPPSNKELYYRILSEGGAILSEFPPEQRVMKGLFVTRNRLISALSDGVLIIEGTNKSGTLKTAGHAADQGRPIFLPPYNLTAPYGYTFSHLMQNGGIFVFSPDDIFYELNLKPPALPPEMTLSLSKDEAELMSHIRSEITSPDLLSERMDLPISTILNRLSELELQGHIAKNSLGEYYIC